MVHLGFCDFGKQSLMLLLITSMCSCTTGLQPFCYTYSVCGGTPSTVSFTNIPQHGSGSDKFCNQPPNYIKSVILPSVLYSTLHCSNGIVLLNPVNLSSWLNQSRRFAKFPVLSARNNTNDNNLIN